jgi:hypothetical protein
MKESPTGSGPRRRPKVPTSFAVTTIFFLVTANSIGQLAPDMTLYPAGTTVVPGLWTLEACNLARGKLDHPEKYFCQRFDSPKTTNWVYTPPGAITPEQVAPSAPAPAPEVKPDPASLRTPEVPRHSNSKLAAIVWPKVVAPEPPKKQLARREAMFEGNPFTAIAGFIGVRGDNW